MPSPVPPLRMPDHLLTELAHGGGSAQALAFLEGGERARRLLLLRTLHAHLDSLPATPLTPAAEVWRVFTAAADKAPEAVDRLLLAPQVGNWLAHMLRRMHGTAHGPPLWAEADASARWLWQRPSAPAPRPTCSSRSPTARCTCPSSERLNLQAPSRECRSAGQPRARAS